MNLKNIKNTKLHDKYLIISPFSVVYDTNPKVEVYSAIKIILLRSQFHWNL